MDHPAPANDVFRSRTITAQDGLALFVRDYAGPAGGAATTVVCLSGLTRNSKDFHSLASHLAAGRRVICPDYRGRGRSAYDANWRNYQPRTYVDDLRHVLAALNVHRVAVVGTSLGGIVAMAMTAAMPAMLAGAVLNDIGPVIDPAGLQRIRGYVKALAPVQSWGEAAALMRRVLPDWPADGEAGWLAVAQATFRQREDGSIGPDWDPAIMRPIEEGTSEVPALWPLFRGLGKRPVMAVRGARSDILNTETVAAMAEALPQMTTVTVPDVGHAPALGTPAERTAISAFLEKVDAA